MKKLVILLSVVLTAFTISDDNHGIRLINWKENDILFFGNISKNILSFNNAEYPDPITCLPYYIENFPVPADGGFTIELNNPVYEEFIPDITVSGIDAIGDRLIYNSSILRTAGQNLLQFSLLPFVKSGNVLKRLVSFELRLVKVPVLKNAAIPLTWKNESVLKNGKWIKIKTSKRGIYRITYDKIKQLGFDDPLKVNLFSNSGYQMREDNSVVEVDDLIQFKIWSGKDNQGKDCIFFYSPGGTKWDFNNQSGFFEHITNVYTRYSSFFLTDNAGSTMQVETYNPVTEQPNKVVAAFDEYELHEMESYNLIHSGKRWFGERFLPGNTRSISFDIQNRETSSPVSLDLTAAARSSSTSVLDISIGNVASGKIEFNAVNTSDPTSVYADDKMTYLSANPSGNSLNISLTFNSSSSSAEGWLDYARINFRKKLRAEGAELFFRDKAGSGAGVIAEFDVENAANFRIFDITEPSEIREVPVTFAGSTLKFIRPAQNLREYLAFNPSGNFPEPEFLDVVKNQNLHGMQDADMIIISHPDFLNHAGELKDFHSSADNLSVNLVSTEEVYNEFGSGNPDATAIRNFIRMMYSRSQKLKYILLFGDGSYDNRNLSGSRKNFIPTYQSDNSLNPVASFVTDDYFVLLDDGESVYNGGEDLGIGRLPVSNDYDAIVVVSKIKNYHSPKSLGFWRNVVCFIGDDEDGNLHMDDSEQLAGMVNLQHKEFLTDKIYFDSFNQVSTPAGERYPGVTAAIDQKVKEGVLILNYIGHANERFMAEEHVLDVSDINSWTNPDNLPIFVTATCEFSRFDGDDVSAGEYILTNPTGGGIGLFSTTRLVYAYSNFLLNQNFFRYVFDRDVNGERYRMGDIMRLAKVATINTINKRNFTLLADPALRLSYPKHKVVTTGLIKNDKIAGSDTIGALGKVTVTGYIADFLGHKLNNFTGKIIPVVYDKAIRLKTLGNAGQEPFEYKLQENIIYKGLASVKSGDFTFSFVIPKDISYDVGSGKIVYYAFPDAGTEDANGAFENFFIGGSADNQINDNQGPNIELFLDDESFKSGDKTSRNPLLLANISDENGINTVGTGIGHDITAILDDDYTNVFILNAFYKANIDDYKSGSIIFPLANLPVGEHRLRLKVWDVANNSSEAEISFYVSGDLVIDQLSNYPNPVSDYTYFTFSHNQPDATFNFILEVFDRTGKRIDILKQKVYSSGMTSVPVRWEKSRSGLSTRNGLYLYRIIIQSEDGSIASKSGKMLMIE